MTNIVTKMSSTNTFQSVMLIIPLYWVFKDHLVPEMFDLQIIQRITTLIRLKTVRIWKEKKTNTDELFYHMRTK